ncbi:AAA family ATPase, partial [Actinocorallia lasiicapitis]
MITDKHIPAEPDDFVGRERDIEDLGQLLDAARLVTLCGPGGIGKTRLALRVAHGLPVKAAWFVELADADAGADADTLRVRVTQAVGGAEGSGIDPESALLAALRDREGLLILDNCEHLVEAVVGLLRGLLAGSRRIRVLATSREPLRIPGENVWRVPALELPAPGGRPEESEAVRMFTAPPMPTSPRSSTRRAPRWTGSMPTT